MAKSNIPVGIDLGTTFSSIAYLDNEGRPSTITNSEGDLTTPSVVFFDVDDIIVGTEAAYAGENDVQRLARAAKRDMGGARYRKKLLDRYLPPEVIQSFVLERLKKDAQLKIGEFTKAVVTVPAYFNEPRRKATQDAGELAGLDVIDIINEPTAAALAYGIQRGFLNEKGEAFKREMILVYDLGGGTFDVTLMEIDKSKFTAIGTAGDVYLGGIDWDQRIYDFVRQEIESKHDVDFDSNPLLREKLMNQCIRAKSSLTARTRTTIRLEHEGGRYKVDFDRDTFEDLTKDLLERTRLTTDRLLRDANLKWSDLTNLLVVGGSTRMPMILNMLEQESGLKIDRSLSPDECVAHGAAVYAGILMKHGSTTGKGLSITNVNSHDLSVLGIDPKTKEPRRQLVIPRNHQLPTKSSKKFQTKEAQRQIVVSVVEGGTQEGHGVTRIGKCVVTDLPAGIKKGTEVLVTFNYLSSGRLNVVAAIPSLKLSADSTIDRSAGMTRDEIVAWKKKLANGVAFLENEPVAKQEKPMSKSVKANPVAGKPTAAKPTAAKPTAAKPTAAKPAAAKPKPAGKPARFKSEFPGIHTGTEEKSLIEDSIKIQLDEDEKQELIEDAKSAIFAFGDDEQGEAAGESILDFLDEATEQKASTSNSSLNEFLSDFE